MAVVGGTQTPRFALEEALVVLVELGEAEPTVGESEGFFLSQFTSSTTMTINTTTTTANMALLVLQIEDFY